MKTKVVSASTLRRYVLVTFLSQKVERTVQEETAEIFRIFTNKLFVELQIQRLIISRPKNETGSRKLLVGIWCDNSSKHTYKQKVEQAFYESTALKIYKVESKKGLGAWAFFLLGEDKELLLSSGGSLFQIEEAATAFSRKVSYKLAETSPAAHRADKSTVPTKKQRSKKGTPYLEGEGLVKRLVSFLFIFAPRLFYRRTVNKLAYIWVALLITFFLSLVFCFLVFSFDFVNIHINYETAEKFNKLMESLGISIIRIPIPPAPPLPWYHYKSIGEVGYKIISKSFLSFCSEKLKWVFGKIWNAVFKK